MLPFEAVAAVLLLCPRIALAQVQAPAADSTDEMTQELRWYIRDQIMAENARREKARAGRGKVPLSQGLPELISPDLPQTDGFVQSERMPGSELAIDDTDIQQQGLKDEDVLEDEEWVRLPDGKTIRREIKSATQGRYEVWHYPPGMRIMHMVYLKNPRRLFEFRFELKLPDELGGRDGPWAFGLYRPVSGAALFQLYTHGQQKPETAVAVVDTTTGPRMVRIQRLNPQSCRVCHIDHGEGWYQYPTEDYAGPCGFAPANKSILAKWAPQYQARYGYFPFIGP